MVPKRQEAERKRWNVVQALLDRRQSVAAICRWWQVSRPFAYRWLRRFKRWGRPGLRERGHRSRRAERLRRGWWSRCRRLRRRYPQSGPIALRAMLQQEFPRTRPPSTATIARWMAAAKLVRRRPRRARPGPTVPAPPWREPRQCNDVWSIDFKGEVRTADGKKLHLLTVRDRASRYLLAVTPVSRLSDAAVRPLLARLFQRWGLPRAIHVDNGAPFGGRGPLGLSTLSVHWLRLGIEVEFSRRARPGDNAGHEQMHGVLQQATAKPAAAKRAAQQRRIQRWTRFYNQVRPHRGLDLAVPEARYRPSRRRWPRASPSWHYRRHWETLQPGANGRASWCGRQRFIGRAFAHEILGLKPITPTLDHVYLGPHLIGSLHREDRAGMRPASRQCILSERTLPSRVRAGRG